MAMELWKLVSTRAGEGAVWAEEKLADAVWMRATVPDILLENGLGSMGSEAELRMD